MIKFVFSVGILKTLIGLLYLASFPVAVDPSQWTLLGRDEQNYFYVSERIFYAIKAEGFYQVISNYFIYTGSEHFVFYFLLAPFHYFSSPLTGIILVKSWIFSFSCWFVLDACRRLNILKSGWSVVFILMVYVPLHLSTLSFLRDDIIFFFLVVAISFSLRSGYSSKIILYFAVLSLAAFRIHLSVSVILYILSLYVLSKKGRLNIWLLAVFASLISLFFMWRGDFILYNIRKLDLVQTFLKIPYEFIRLVLSPNPFYVSESYPIIMKLWFAVSLPISMVSTIFIVLVAMCGKLKNFEYCFLLMCFIYFLPYVAIDTLGFRQIMLVAPLIFLFVGVPAFKRVYWLS